jgi:hypothetical protein
VSGTAGYNAKFTSTTSLGNSIIYDTGTRIGIGTESPSQTLTVNGSAIANQYYVANAGNWFDIGSNSELRARINSPNGLAILPAASEIMRITSSGVAIGKTGPSAFLDVASSSVTEVMRIATGPSGIIMSANGASGYVGFGTTGPTYRIDVQGSNLQTSSIRAQGAFDFNILLAPTGITGYTLSAGTNLGVGTYYYYATFVTAIGETNAPGSFLQILTVVTVASSTTVNLVGIPVSTDPRVISRKLYRSKIGGSIDGQFFLATINDNVTTTYTDSATDASLGSVGLQYYRINTTTKYVTVGGTQILVADQNLTTLGLRSGSNLISTGNSSIRSVFVGADAGRSVTTGQANVIVGVSGVQLTTGSSNVLLGDLAGYDMTTGNQNVIIGAQAGRRLVGSVANNTIVGGNNTASTLADGSTQFTGGQNCTVLGSGIRMSTTTDTNSIVIGATAWGLGSNTTVIGNTSVTLTAIPAGKISIGATSAVGCLTVAPAANISVLTSSTYLLTGANAQSAIDLSGTWNTTGSPTGVKVNLANTASGATANLFDFQLGGTTYIKVDKGGKISQFATNTAGGVTGNQTIDRPTGTVNIAAAGTSVTVTNNLVTTSSLVFAVIRTNDSTATIKNVVPLNGSFTINLGAAANAEISVGFWVIN